MNDAPLLRACPLWKKTSSKGRSYLVGRMGGVRVMVMAVREPTEKGPTHELLFTAASPWRQHEGDTSDREGE